MAVIFFFLLYELLMVWAASYQYIDNNVLDTWHWTLHMLDA